MRILPALAALALSLALACGGAAAAPAAGGLSPNALHSWSIYDDKEAKTYRVGDITLKAGSLKGGQGLSVEITAPGMAPFRLKDADVYATLHFGVGKLDAAEPRQILLQTYTGGAHCCTQWTVLTAKGGKWTASVLGQWDGEGGGDWPKDEDGDGVIDIVLFDQAFLYAFASYADSWPPPRIYHLQAGKLVDVSDRRGLAPLFETQAKEAGAACREKSAGACAAYVADASRLGRRAEAWAVMLEAMKDNPAGEDWLPEGCKVARDDDGMCRKGQEVVYKSYPEALAAFLKDHGYGP